MSARGGHEVPEKRFKRSDLGMISGLIEGREISGNLCVISPSTVCSIDRVKELLWTRGSKCVLATEEVSEGDEEADYECTASQGL